jgi:3,4-dihydroxy 2-butanone 4-phosphate synthase/GTP cyclohydrolase II
MHRRPGTGSDGAAHAHPSVHVVDAALAELRRGRMVLVLDDEDRENEGDLIMAAELATPEAIGFMIRHTSGLICVGVPGERADALELGPMVEDADDPRGTAFTVSVDLKSGTRTSRDQAMCSPCVPAPAAYSTVPGTPRAPSTCAGSPASSRRVCWPR